MSINDGGPAFPIPFEAHTDGMSLRNYFAAHALQAIVNHPEKIDSGAKELNVDRGKFTARTAYYFADAMIAERNKQHRKEVENV